MKWAIAEKRVAKRYEKEATIKMSKDRARRNYIKRVFHRRDIQNRLIEFKQ